MGGRIRRGADYASWERRGRDVIDLAKGLGFDPREVWAYFWTFTTIVADAKQLPLEIAEDSAWRLLRASIDKLAWANETDGWCH